MVKKMDFGFGGIMMERKNMKGVI
jgi:hypothetical protein